MSKGLLKHNFKQYGLVILIIMLINVFAVLSEEGFSQKRVQVPQDGKEFVYNVFNKKDMTYSEYEDSEGNKYYVDNDFGAINIVYVDVYTDGKLYYDYELEDYDYDINALLDDAIEWEKAVISMLINNTMVLAFWIPICGLIVFMFYEIKRNVRYNLLASLPVTRKEIITSVTVFIQTSLLAIWTVVSILILLQTKDTGYNQMEIFAALVGSLMINAAICELFIFLSAVVKNSPAEVAVFFLGFYLFVLCSCTISNFSYMMFGIEGINPGSKISNGTVLMSYVYAEMKRELSFNEYIVKYLIGIFVCLLLVVLFYFAAIAVFKAYDASSKKGFFSYRLKPYQMRIKYCFISLIISEIAVFELVVLNKSKNLNFGELFMFMSDSYLSKNGNDKFEYLIYEMPKGSVLLGIATILIGIGIGLIWSNYKIKKRGAANE